MALNSDFYRDQGMDGFRTDIGSADKGRTFVRVTHVDSGKERIVVGIGDANPRRIIEELQQEIIKEIESEKTKQSASHNNL
jgi:hypothetical protein